MNSEETNSVHFNRCLQDGNVNYRYDCYQWKRERSYPWFRKHPQAQGLIDKTVMLVTHRTHRERAPPPKFMPIQDGRIHLGILIIVSHRIGKSEQTK